MFAGRGMSHRPTPRRWRPFHPPCPCWSSWGASTRSARPIFARRWRDSRTRSCWTWRCAATRSRASRRVRTTTLETSSSRTRHGCRVHRAERDSGRRSRYPHSDGTTNHTHQPIGGSRRPIGIRVIDSKEALMNRATDPIASRDPRDATTNKMRRLIVLATLFVVSAMGLATSAGSARAKVVGPNGQLVFARYDPSIDDSHVFTSNPDGTHEQQLLSTAAEIPHWSPDGSRIAMICCPDLGLAPTIINADGSGLR